MLESLSLDLERYELAALRVIARWGHDQADYGTMASAIERASASVGRGLLEARRFVARQKPSPGIRMIHDREMFAARAAARADIGSVAGQVAAAWPIGEEAVQSVLDDWARRGIAGPVYRGRHWALTTWVEHRSSRAATLARAVRQRGG